MSPKENDNLLGGVGPPTPTLGATPESTSGASNSAHGSSAGNGETRPAQTEVGVAVQFLTDLVKTRCKGIAASAASETTTGGSGSVLCDQTLGKLTAEMERVLLSHYEKHWFPGQPHRGMAYRCVRINGKLDPLLVKAGKNIGMEHATMKLYFPAELTIWIDPGQVSYRIGEEGSVCELYKDPKAKSLLPGSGGGKKTGGGVRKVTRKSASQTAHHGAATIAPHHNKPKSCGSVLAPQNSAASSSPRAAASAATHQHHQLVQSQQVQHGGQQLLPVSTQQSLMPVATFTQGMPQSMCGSGPHPTQAPPHQFQHQQRQTSPVPLSSAASPAADHHGYLSSSGGTTTGSSYGSCMSSVAHRGGAGQPPLHRGSPPPNLGATGPPPPTFSRGLSVGSLGDTAGNKVVEADWDAILSTATLLVSQHAAAGGAGAGGGSGGAGGAGGDVHSLSDSSTTHKGQHAASTHSGGGRLTHSPPLGPPPMQHGAAAGGVRGPVQHLHPSASYPNFHPQQQHPQGAYGHPPPGMGHAGYPPQAPAAPDSPQRGGPMAPRYHHHQGFSPNANTPMGQQNGYHHHHAPPHSPGGQGGPAGAGHFMYQQGQMGAGGNGFHPPPPHHHPGAHGGPMMPPVTSTYQPYYGNGPASGHHHEGGNNMEFCKDNLERLVEYMNIPIASMGSG